MVDDYRSVDTADIDDDFPDISEDVLGPARRDGSSDSASADMVRCQFHACMFRKAFSVQ